MRNLIYMFVLVLVVLACGKEEVLSDNQMLSNADGKRWVLNQVIIDTTDVTEDIDACVLDNERIFYSDYTFEMTEGDTTCVNTEDVSEIGTWQFNNVKTTLKIAIGTDTAEYIVKELYKNKMKLFFIDQSTGDNINWELVTK